jgi:hypothetical protein
MLLMGMNCSVSPLSQCLCVAWVAILGLLLALHAADPEDVGGVARLPTHQLELKGKANGGDLVLTSPPGVCAEISIKTAPGESAEVVAGRLYAALKAAPDVASEFMRPGEAGVTGGVISGMREPLYWGPELLAGSETGLGIPPPPRSVTLRYDFKADEILILWETSSKDVDASLPWALGGLAAFPDNIQRSGSVRRFIFQNASSFMKMNHGGFPMTVINYSGRTPSAGSSVQLTGNRLDEVNESPFPGRAVAPNWESYVATKDGSRVEFKEGVMQGWRRRVHQYYQEFRVSSGAEDGRYRFGVWRKFLGLTPGRMYRVGLKWYCWHGDAPANARLTVAVAGLADAGGGLGSKDFEAGETVGASARQILS